MEIAECNNAIKFKKTATIMKTDYACPTIQVLSTSGTSLEGPRLVHSGEAYSITGISIVSTEMSLRFFFFFYFLVFYFH